MITVPGQTRATVGVNIPEKVPSAKDQLEAQERRRQKAILSGTERINEAFAGFTPEFFSGVRDAHLSSLMPQLANQYQNTNRQLSFNLANRGLLSSSSAQNMGNSLARETSRNATFVGNQANQAARDFQGQVQGQKSSLINQLLVSQDPALAAQQAIGTAATLQAPSPVAPLGNLFQQWANTYLARQLYNQPPGGGYGFNAFRPSAPQVKNYIDR